MRWISDQFSIITFKIYSFSFSLNCLPEWPVLSSIINVEKHFELLAQIGAHQTLHVDEQVMSAGRRGRLLLTMPMFHLQRRGQSSISISRVDNGILYLQLRRTVKTCIKTTGENTHSAALIQDWRDGFGKVKKKTTVKSISSKSWDILKCRIKAYQTQLIPQKKQHVDTSLWYWPITFKSCDIFI